MISTNSSGAAPASSKELLLEVDGCVHDFTKFSTLGVFVEVVASYFLKRCSTNPQLGSRIKTNATLFFKAQLVLKFTMAQKELGHHIGFSPFLYNAYYAFLTKQYAPSTVASFRSFVAGLYRYAMDTGRVSAFALPRGLSVREASAASKSGETLADSLRSGALEGLSYTEINLQLITILRAFCWERSRIAHARLMRGDEWRRSAILSKQDFEMEMLRAKSREELLEFAVKALVARCFGVSGATDHLVFNRAVIRVFVRQNKETLGRFGEPITGREINDHLFPTAHHIACFAPLFAMERINPENILGLTLDMLEEQPGGKTKVIRWRKGRSASEIVVGPFRSGTHRSNNIAQAWRLLTEIGDLVRSNSMPGHENKLFLMLDVHKFKGRPPGAHQIQLPTLLESINLHLQEIVNPEFEALRYLDGRVTLKAVRNTVINLIGTKFGSGVARRAVRHRHSTTTARYLKSPDFRGLMENEMERGQAYMVSFIEGRLLVISPDCKTLQLQMGLSNGQSEQALEEETTLSFGVTLSDDKAFVIDTPLNCLRVAGWIEAIETAEERIRSNNEERWEHFWRPQLALFVQAHEDFPRKTKAAARQLGKTLSLSFPEPN